MISPGAFAALRLTTSSNVAGVEPRKAAPTAEYEEEEWNRIFDINLRGMFLCMKYEIPLILKQGGGAIVNTSSGAGVIGIKGSPAYTAAKHGVLGLTRAAALDYAAQHPDQRDLPRVHRHPDDGSLQRGRSRGPRQGDRGRTGRADGPARGDRGGCHLALLGRVRVHDRPRHGDGWRSDGAVARTRSRDQILSARA